jgi:hypothetical protein
VLLYGHHEVEKVSVISVEKENKDRRRTHESTLSVFCWEKDILKITK